MKKKGYWYKFTIIMCPVCNKTDKLKERVYDEEKPVLIEDRYESFFYTCQNCKI
jgi:hypothetical protein